MDTSSLNPLRCMDGAREIDDFFVAERKPLEAGQTHDFCMLLSCSHSDYHSGSSVARGQLLTMLERASSAFRIPHSAFRICAKPFVEEELTLQ